MNDDSKLRSGALHRLAEARDDELIDVIVELQPPPLPEGGSRQSRIQAIQDDFSRSVRAVAAAVEDLGGQILDQAWINCTLNARIPANGVRRLTALGEVLAVDIPRRIESDSGP
jgi:hypothetical protein